LDFTVLCYNATTVNSLVGVFIKGGGRDQIEPPDLKRLCETSSLRGGRFPQRCRLALRGARTLRHIRAAAA